MADIPKTNLLLSPFDLRGLSLKNRVVMSPLTRSRAGKERVPNSLIAEYYAQRASSGLIITEATVISIQGIGWPNSPGIYSDQQAEAWKMVVDAVHARGTPIFLQLWHCGRASHSSFHEKERLPVAPSAIKIIGDEIRTPIGKQPYETPRALETEEVSAIVKDYRRAAERAKSAGFDGVEIHAANGYLIDQFLQSKTCYCIYEVLRQYDCPPDGIKNFTCNCCILVRYRASRTDGRRRFFYGRCYIGHYPDNFCTAGQGIFKCLY